MTKIRGTSRQYWVAVRAMLVMTVVLGILYPLLVTGVGQLAFNAQANGTIRQVDGEPVGSALIGQGFVDEDELALPEWFQSRPSAAGAGWDGAASSGSNYGPENPDLLDAIAARQQAISELDGVSVDQIPADAVTASGSGLDPHISPDYARLQVPRVAEARGLEESAVAELVESRIQSGDLGYLGDPTVNVLDLNIALQQMDPDGSN
ncbi:potassium-transporting ATPase subunit KdpC [Compostimonas suwonensis]|uniref:Potassium-transporting ATPase KdpC subunit n=1 Tax=Compostimonas suwonensis TaxID=1048394 RepID=A0A2M9BBG8_9MICO|nr:potassium-transporting ATPase subunit KdpC [Compostimonas suwonensis]PJJ55290.1 K+-transporting ATPase ATPase C chain [Compostimonas suwonensis]